MRRRGGIGWTPGRRWAAAGLGSLGVFGVVLRTGRVGLSLVFLGIATGLVIVGITVDKRWRWR